MMTPTPAYVDPVTAAAPPATEEWDLPATPHECSTPPKSAHDCQTRHVSFCPLAYLIEGAAPCSQDVEKPGAAGRPRLTSRSYSWDTGKLAHTWTRVIGSLGASLDPIFSRGDIGGDVCGSSSSPSTTRVELITDDEDSTMASGSKEDEDEKEGGKITIRLPGLTRIPSRPRSQSVSDAAGGMYQCRGILKPPDRRAFAFPAVDPTPPPSSRITSTSSPTSTPGLEHVTVLSVHSAIALAPIQTTSLPSPPLDGQTVSLSPCCINCCHATDLGRDAGDDYVEKWTSGARKKRREDANGFVHRASVVVDEAEGPQSPGTPAEEDPRKSCEDEAVFHDHLPTTTVSSSTFRLIARPSPPLSDPSNLLPAEPSPTYAFDTMDSNIVGLSTVTTGKKPKSKFSFASLFPDGGARTYV